MTDVYNLAMSVAPAAELNGQVGRFRERLHVGDAICDLPPPTPLVKGLLFTPGQSVLYAPPKTCKTFFSLGLGLCVATGTAFMGHDVEQGSVLYVVAEGLGGIGQRVEAWRSVHDDVDIAAAAFLTCAVNLTEPGAVAELCAIAAERAATLVVLDTLARCAVGADENSARDMGRIVDGLDQLRDATSRHVHVVHHAGKDVTRGMRGSNALLGAVDTVIELSGDALAIRVRNTDQKDAEPCDPWWCRLQPAMDSAVLVRAADLDVEIGAQATVLEALEALPPRDRTATNWQKNAEDMDVSRSTFFRAKKQLLARGSVAGGERRGSVYTIVEGEEA